VLPIFGRLRFLEHRSFFHSRFLARQLNWNCLALLKTGPNAVNVPVRIAGAQERHLLEAGATVKMEVHLPEPRLLVEACLS